MRWGPRICGQSSPKLLAHGAKRMRQIRTPNMREWSGFLVRMEPLGVEQGDNTQIKTVEASEGAPGVWTPLLECAFARMCLGGESARWLHS